MNVAPGLLPLLLMMAGGTLFCGAGLFIGANRWWSSLSACVLALAAWSLSRVPNAEALNAAAYAAPILADGFGLTVQWLALAIGFFFTCLGLKRQESNSAAGAVFGAILLSLSGVMLCGVANDLVVLFAAISMATLPIAPVLILSADDPAGRQVGRTYFLMGLLAVALLMLGFGFIYGLARGTNLAEIATNLGASYLPASADSEPVSGSRLGVAALVLSFAGAAIILAAAPFQFGRPEVLEKAAPWPAGIVATVPLLAAVIVVVRVPLQTLVGFSEAGMLFAAVTAGGTMIYAAVMSSSQIRLRRMLSYIAVGQGGFVLTGIAVEFWSSGPALAVAADRGLLSGLTAAVFQLGVSTMSLAVLFAVLTYLQRRDRETEYVDDLKGLLRTEPTAAVCLLIAIGSLVGVPLLPGFWSRLLIFLSALSVETEIGGRAVSGPHVAFVALAFAAGVSMLLMSSPLIRMITAMFFNVPMGRSRPAGGRGALAVAVVAAAILLFAGFFPGVFVTMAQRFRPR